jgi:hypothetical protein
MRIANFRSWRTNSGGSRVEADIDGEPLWFDSGDAPLTPSPEGFASALLIAAATRGEPIEVDAAVDRSWLEQVPGIVRQVEQWWQLPGTRVIAAGVVDAPRATPGVTAQCFTGGVDSFYALIIAKALPGMLVFGHGYDIPLDDSVRLDAFLAGFRETAAAFGTRSVLIATNLQQHRATAGIDLRRSHGGALAALGHFLAKEVERIVIPSSYPYHDPKPWGSHWDLDPLWSSRRMTVEHADATCRRNGKVRAIADHPMVRRHLRVCSTTKTPTGNCGHCEKCIRTMIAFAMCGRLDACEAFDRTLPIERRVEKMSIVKPHLVSIYEELIGGIEEPQLKAAVKRLIADSRGRPAWLYQRMRRWRRKAAASRAKRLWDRLF